MKLIDALEGFYLARTADGVSPHTLQIYKWALVPLCMALDNPEVSEITTYMLRRYLVDVIATEKYSQLSVQMIHRCIKAFYTWAEVDLEIEKRPDRLLKKPVGKGREIQPFTLEEVERMIKVCDLTNVAETNGNRRIFQMHRSTAKRDRAIILLLLDTGIRAGEMCRLNINDINLETGDVIIKPFRSSHKSRPRTTYIGKMAKRSLWVYLKERNNPESNEPLFLSGEEFKITRFNSNHLGKLIRSLGERAGVKNAHPHRFRHTMAIQYLRNRGDPFTLRRIMGLASWNVMQIYLQLAQLDMKEMHRTASPVDNWRL